MTLVLVDDEFTHIGAARSLMNYLNEMCSSQKEIVRSKLLKLSSEFFENFTNEIDVCLVILMIVRILGFSLRTSSHSELDLNIQIISCVVLLSMNL